MTEQVFQWKEMRLYWFESDGRTVSDYITLCTFETRLCLIGLIG